MNGFPQDFLQVSLFLHNEMIDLLSCTVKLGQFFFTGTNTNFRHEQDDVSSCHKVFKVCFFNHLEDNLMHGFSLEEN